MHTNSDPIYLKLENRYNLNVLKEITASKSFLSMEKDVRKCQDVETFSECVTTKFICDLKSKCKCLPLNLRLTMKVDIKLLGIHIYNSFFHCLGSSLYS